MRRIGTRIVVIGLLVTVAAGSVQAARYRYGRGVGGRGEQAGVIVSIQGELVNVRNADLLYATSESLQIFGGGVNEISALGPAGEDDVAGRLGVGYQWANGNRLSASLWSYESSSSAIADGPLGGALHFALGPPIALGGGAFVGDSGSPGHFDLSTTIETAAFDLAFGRTHGIGDEFSMEWSTGLRYASYEETTGGFYDDAISNAGSFGDHRYTVAKSIEGTMVGARLAAQGRYFFTPSFSVSAGVGFAFLDGEIEASSALTPSGLVNAVTQPMSRSVVNDDGKSGRTADFHVRTTWHNGTDRLRVWVGWEQQEWSGIAEDSQRSFPGTTRPLGNRNSITLSGYEVGLSYRF
jgi:hypothetical protein